MKNKKKVTLIVGHYGSGKSEFAVNYALTCKKAEDAVCLVDLDIVNPYFRSREVREMLESLGITVLSDAHKSQKGLDMPYLSPAIKGHLENRNERMIFDCGGDPVGLVVLKQFERELKQREVEVLMVINTFRPETSTVELIMAMIERLETALGFKITAFVNNSNLLYTTTASDMIGADTILKAVQKTSGIKVHYLSGVKSLLDQLPEEIAGEHFYLTIYLRDQWL